MQWGQRQAIRKGPMMVCKTPLIAAGKRRQLVCEAAELRAPAKSHMVRPLSGILQTLSFCVANQPTIHAQQRTLICETLIKRKGDKRKKSSLCLPQGPAAKRQTAADAHWASANFVAVIRATLPEPCFRGLNLKRRDANAVIPGSAQTQLKAAKHFY